MAWPKPPADRPKRLIPENMFSLEQSIADWRQQMLAGGIKSPVPLDELEEHLRDSVERQMRSGISPELAFENTVQSMGQTAELKQEFSKAAASNRIFEQLKHVIFTLAGIPSPILVTNMNTSFSNPDPEPRWATYLKGAVFLVPALTLWTITFVFLMPKLHEIMLRQNPNPPAFFRFAQGLTHDWWLGAAVVIFVLLLLEWRCPRHRRAVIGFGVFTLNAVLLLLMAGMMTMAIILAANYVPRPH
jgi:hypothetical protein